mgnify:CR=1 FL=1
MLLNTASKEFSHLEEHARFLDRWGGRKGGRKGEGKVGRGKGAKRVCFGKACQGGSPNQPPGGARALPGQVGRGERGLGGGGDLCVSGKRVNLLPPPVLGWMGVWAAV